MKPRKQPMRRTPLKASAPKPKRLKRPPMDPELRKAVFARSQGYCDMCGRGMHKGAFEAHHRKLRSQGGPDTMANIIAIHSICHAEAHANPRWAYAHGYMVPSWADPETWPVLRFGRLWQQPTDRGWVDAEPHEDQIEDAA